jgi:hypothetical protein
MQFTMSLISTQQSAAARARVLERQCRLQASAIFAVHLAMQHWLLCSSQTLLIDSSLRHGLAPNQHQLVLHYNHMHSLSGKPMHMDAVGEHLDNPDLDQPRECTRTIHPCLSSPARDCL